MNDDVDPAGEESVGFYLDCVNACNEDAGCSSVMTFMIEGTNQCEYYDVDIADD